MENLSRDLRTALPVLTHRQRRQRRARVALVRRLHLERTEKADELAMLRVCYRALYTARHTMSQAEFLATRKQLRLKIYSCVVRAELIRETPEFRFVNEIANINDFE